MRAIALLLLMLGLASCGLAEVVMDTEPKDQEAERKKVGEPAWVAGGSGASMGGSDRVFYGIGIASNMRSAELLQETSDSRARQELSKVLKDFALRLEAEAYPAAAEAERKRLVAAIEESASVSLTSAQVVRHWTNPVSGALYSLARVALDTVKDDLGSARSLSAEERKRVSDALDKTHEAMLRGGKR